MSIADTFSYFVTLVAIAVAPGPMLLLLITRAGSNDVKGALGFAFGAALGSFSIITAVCLGMSEFLERVPEFLNVSKYIMLAYILWIAWDIWKGGFDMNTNAQSCRSGFGVAVIAGFTTCVLSPYMLVLFPLALPEILDVTSIQMPEFLTLALTTFFAEAFAAIVIIAFAAQLRRFARSARSMQIMNRSLASLLVVGGGWMVLG